MQTKLLCVRLGIFLLLPMCSLLMYHSLTECRKPQPKSIDDYSTVSRTADRRPYLSKMTQKIRLNNILKTIFKNDNSLSNMEADVDIKMDELPNGEFQRGLVPVQKLKAHTYASVLNFGGNTSA